MATASAAAQSPQTAVKRPGPPVPPRPLQAGLMRAQREAAQAARTAAAAAAASAAATTTTAAATTTTASSTTTTTTPPVIQKKPTFVSQLSAVGRTLVYKSPSLNLQKKQAQTQTPTTTLGTAPKPPLKLRKAPDVPTAKPRTALDQTLPTQSGSAAAAGHTITVNRHNSLSSHATPLKDTRLSLGKLDFERAGLQLTTQPLPKPRKIVQMPVATLDMDDMPAFVAPPATPATSIFRRSKTTLEGLAITERSTLNGNGNGAANGGGGGGGYLSGKTVEIKNNLKNAAERLFSEIIINQKQCSADPTIIIKHERAIQHQALLEQELAQERQKRNQQHQQQLQRQVSEVTIVTSNAAGNRTCININGSSNKPGGVNSNSNSSSNANASANAKGIKTSVSAGNTPEKKHAFHELLISELAAMRNRSCSLEHLASTQPAGVIKASSSSASSSSSPPTSDGACGAATVSGVAAANAKAGGTATPTPTKSLLTRKRYNSIDDHEDHADSEDVDADNVEDADGDEEDTLTYAINKSLKANGTDNSPRKRCPSGCSSDSSPYGTERSQRIRTSDWIEVGDNGKQVTLTSCHISLEDSGLEDEERLDDMSSSGVGDSWDSVKEAENEKRSRNVKRVMSISGLPPLPKSLSGFNKLLGSDSGLLSDVDAQLEQHGSQTNNNNNNHNNDNDNDNNKENDSGCVNNKPCQQASQKDSDNNNGGQQAAATKDGNDNEKDKSASALALTVANANANENENPTTITAKATTVAAAATATSSPAHKANAAASTGSTLDAQIATLRKEMYGLRQLDLSLLSQLWALNDSIQEFRTMIEDQEMDEEDDEEEEEEDNEEYDSVSSEGGADADIVMQATTKSAMQAKRLGTIPKVITTQPKLSNEAIPKQQQRAKHNSDMKPVPRMRSAPPPPPAALAAAIITSTPLITTVRKAAAPPRPT